MMTNQKQDSFLLVLHILNLTVRFNQDRKKNCTKQSFRYSTGNTLKDKKAAKIIIKRAKEHPDWYTEQDVKFAKMVKKRIKREKQAKKSEMEQS